MLAEIHNELSAKPVSKVTGMALIILVIDSKYIRNIDFITFGVNYFILLRLFSAHFEQFETVFFNIPS